MRRLSVEGRVVDNGGMNMRALFEKLAVDLESHGVVADDGETGPELVFEGRPFARLVGDRLAIYLPPGGAGRDDALALESSRPADDGEWVEVDAGDVSEWPRLAEHSLHDLRHDEPGEAPREA